MRTVGVLFLVVASVLRARAQDVPAPQTPPAPPAPPASVQAPAPPASPATNLTEAGAAALQRAKEAFKTGTWQDALEAALKVLAEQPAHLEALYIAGASERQTGQFAAAAGHLATLLDRSPNFPLVHFQLGYVNFLQAESLTREGDGEGAKAKYSAAADEFGKELDKNPTHAASTSSRAVALTRAGRLDESLPAHDAWIVLAPTKNEPLVSLAVTHALAGRSSEAMAALDRLPVKDQKAQFDAVLTVAGVFIAHRDWGAAIPFLEKAQQTDPTAVRARSLLTQAYARGMEYDDAVKSLEALLAMDPPPAEAEAAGEAIKATIGNGKSSQTRPGIEPPMALKVPVPRYPKGQDTTVETEVLVLAKINVLGKVDATVVVPNRIWKDMRATGFEAEAIDAVKRGRFAAGTKNQQPADLWVVVAVKFAKS